MTTVGVGLVLPHPLPRSPLLSALRRDPRVRVVFEVHDLADLSAAVSGPRPAVILADADVAGGVRPLMRALKARFAGVPVVLFDRTADPARAQRARNLGAAAVLTFRSRPERFVARVLDVAETAGGARPLPPRLFDRLTPREWDILCFLAQRYSAREIAAELTLSYATVRTHIRNIYAKCGVGSREAAARVAEHLLRERPASDKEVSRDERTGGRDGRADSQSQRVQVHPGSGGN
ncbi:MAG: response regulator transcription factor [Firmicutes bacterium]|nr:response regulator transcription factor [Bacillota bacterium]